MTTVTTPPPRVRVYLDARDWWIGLYVGPHHLSLCPLPTLVIRLRRPARRASGVNP